MSTALHPRCAIAVMAKAPRIGEAKTRLLPALSPAAAAGLSACFIRDAAGNIAAAGREAAIDAYIAYSPPEAEGEFRELMGSEVRLLPSRRAGLAASLYDAAADLLLAGYGSVCLVNSDSPTLPTSVLAEAARTLSGPDDRIVLGPAEDGGYYLIGLKAAEPRIFADIAWSSPVVAQETAARARETGLPVALLPPWYDVDDEATLRRLSRALEDGQERAEASRKLLSRRLFGRLGEVHPA